MALTGRLSPSRLMPGLARLREYDRRDLPSDLVAGLTLGAVMVPVGLAFGDLAHVGPVAGLYSAILPLIAYVLFGSSRQLVVGPDASTPRWWE